MDYDANDQLPIVIPQHSSVFFTISASLAVLLLFLAILDVTAAAVSFAQRCRPKRHEIESLLRHGGMVSVDFLQRCSECLADGWPKERIDRLVRSDGVGATVAFPPESALANVDEFVSIVEDTARSIAIQYNATLYTIKLLVGSLSVSSVLALLAPVLLKVVGSVVLCCALYFLYHNLLGRSLGFAERIYAQPVITPWTSWAHCTPLNVDADIADILAQTRTSFSSYDSDMCARDSLFSVSIIRIIRRMHSMGWSYGQALDSHPIAALCGSRSTNS
mmetsp:Transcript_3807/g.12308  ORF Transcript_3807/g.12308 Transcript_3807/m.12308 type:complete len:276 (-) Transcript_3807:91-918(-)